MIGQQQRKSEASENNADNQPTIEKPRLRIAGLRKQGV